MHPLPAGLPPSILQSFWCRPLCSMYQNCKRLCRYYRALADFVDGDSHGTHCAGSTVGSLQAGTLHSWPPLTGPAVTGAVLHQFASVPGPWTRTKA